MIAQRFKVFMPTIIAIAVCLYGLVNILMGIFPIFRIHFQQQWLIYTKIFEVSPIEHASYILSVFIGLLLIALGRGLYRRLRMAWMWTLGVSLVSVINSVYPTFSLLTFILSLLFVLVLLIFNHEFYIRSQDPMRYEHVVAGLSLVFSLAYGIAGSYILRDEFHGIHNVIDAVYYTLVTYSTLGYGDIVPVTTNAKVFTCSMIIIGISSFVATLTVVVGPLIEKRMKGVFSIMNKLTMKDHVIICGYNTVALHIAKSLAKFETDCVFLENNTETAQAIRQQGYHVIMGESGSQKDLERANIQEAKSIVCAHLNDADNILTVMTAYKYKQDNKNLKIVTRIDKEEHLEKAKEVGADSIISPAVYGGELMAKEALG
jgi:voltage-gated potassium channel